MPWLLALTLVAGLQAAAQPQPQAFFTASEPVEALRGKPAVIETSMGTIVLDLLADAATNHVAHFIARAKEGAYDGTVFHRVIPMGMVHGGDPVSKNPAEKEK